MDGRIADPDFYMPLGWTRFHHETAGQQRYVTLAYLRVINHYWFSDYLNAPYLNIQEHKAKICIGLEDDFIFLRRLGDWDATDEEWKKIKSFIFDGNKRFILIKKLWHHKQIREDWLKKSKK